MVYINIPYTVNKAFKTTTLSRDYGSFSLKLKRILLPFFSTPASFPPHRNAVFNSHCRDVIPSRMAQTRYYFEVHSRSFQSLVLSLFSCNTSPPSSVYSLSLSCCMALPCTRLYCKWIALEMGEII